MKFSKLLTAVLLITTLMVAGCGGSDEATGPTFQPYVGGTQGVTLNFLPGMPPQAEGAILDNGQGGFSVGVQITNKGEYDLQEGELELRLRGILPEQYGITYADLQKELDVELPGSKKQIDGSVLEGQSTSLIFEDLSYQPDAPGDLPVALRVDACYNYKTKSTTQVCIASDVQGSLVDSQGAVCNVNEQKKTINSGGPVHITNFRQTPKGTNKISVMFDVIHQGTGSVYALQSPPNNCDTSVINPDRNEVILDIYLSDQSGAEVTCTAGLTGTTTPTQADPISGEVKLPVGAPRTITCTLAETSSDDAMYTDQLNIDMYYNYGQSKNLQLLIKDFGSVNS